MTDSDPTRGPSRYGAAFDTLADRWAWNEAEHDLVHPDRGECGGVGACEMMAHAFDLREAMRDRLEAWRRPDTDPAPLVITVDEAHAVLEGSADDDRSAVHELMLRIVLAGRDSRVFLGTPRPPMWQFPDLEAVEAAIAAGHLPMPPGWTTATPAPAATGSDQ